MYEKIKQINNSLWDEFNAYKLWAIIWISLSILTVLSFTVGEKFSTILAYPEEAYQALENEATKMANTHNLETEYKCIYTYDNTTNTLSLDLRDNNRDSVYITATISDYNTDKPDINITRSIETKLSFILRNSIADFIAFPALVSWLIILAILFTLGLAHLIAFIFHKIGEKVFKPKE